MRAKNVIDIFKLSEKTIKKAFKKISSKKFKLKIKTIKNPYGDGKSSKRIIDILSKTEINDKLMFKRITY